MNLIEAWGDLYSYPVYSTEAEAYLMDIEDKWPVVSRQVATVAIAMANNIALLS